MRCVFVALLGLVVAGLVGCDEEALAAKYGIKIKEVPPGSGKYVVVEDPAHGQIGQAVEIAKEGTSGIPIAGQIVGGLSLLSSLLYNWLLGRMKTKAEEMTAAKQAQLDEHDNTHLATNLGLQAVMDKLPPDLAKMLAAELDKHHDALDVPAEHQDAIQPVIKA